MINVRDILTQDVAESSMSDFQSHLDQGYTIVRDKELAPEGPRVVVLDKGGRHAPALFVMTLQGDAVPPSVTRGDYGHLEDALDDAQRVIDCLLCVCECPDMPFLCFHCSGECDCPTL